ncbi:REP-associated tyrosine transposase [Sabulibacter ruber]|uniref:REP-associated tyrosine transposase n=1 Tax=Sabulibacter ruber TaxID=2811901 RepID=UPI001A97551C|nr:transposase [Sabulibacter ruber]
MSEYRKAFPDELYFVTLTVAGWVDVFTRREYKDLLVENLQYCQQKEGLEIFSYVLMPNHLHLVARRQEQGLSEVIGRFKSFTAKKLLAAIAHNPVESRKEWLLFLFQRFAKTNTQYGTYHFWQYTNHPTPLPTPVLIQQKVDYIHQNPVRAGLVTTPETYLYSSACPDSPLKVSDL